MKIFISHSSKNADYGNALVNLLTGVGINGDQIIFTSNDAYGIPIGNNIFDWLKTRITEKPYVLYLLSPEYYKSVACLNEMGAAWVIENKHTMIFTPNFKIDSYEFQNGAIDPRKIGFFINNNDKLLEFIEALRADYTITSSPVLISQKIREFLSTIESFHNSEKKELLRESIVNKSVETVKEKPITIKSNDLLPKKYIGESRFFKDLLENKLKDEEIILAHYIIDTAKFKLLTGWQLDLEIKNIKVWEDVNGINNTLSNNYESALRRYEMKKLTEVFAVTGGGNTKEVKITNELKEELLELPEEVQNKIHEVLSKNIKEEIKLNTW
ncbi:hypothetical protein HNQ02_003828 [Flavobacterium sp. 7E]|uniref:toll/interleukin-1 receptor domain-containing protein n=1 Tax=Flavobacterium sp. 7E TaxID=2735898 RepID=UPI00157062A1|nr:toll/interleukin-1 receptor domain-containing protein [Flavobacterium sp. 7E]NRS90881.1 hypothetical protein [Flavobacterium sp. 7E]